MNCKLCNEYIATFPAFIDKPLCVNCIRIIPDYIPEKQWEKYYHEKIRPT